MNRIAEKMHNKTITILPSMQKINQLNFLFLFIGNFFYEGVRSKFQMECNRSVLIYETDAMKGA
jgi:hypothetical protein